MGYDALIRAGVALADRLTGSLQAPVTHRAWVSQSTTGAVTYAAPTTALAIVEHRQQLVRATDGREVMASTRLTFLRPLALDPKDQLTLADGTRLMILALEGLLDPGAAVTGRSYYRQAWCGRG